MKSLHLESKVKKYRKKIYRSDGIFWKFINVAG